MSKNREEIKDLFKKDDVLTEASFDELIDATYNLKSDSVDIEYQDILNSSNFVLEQTPSGLDTPLQISFGATATGTPNVDKVSLATNGTMTFRDAKSYRMTIETHYGRTGSSGIALLLAYFTVNDQQVGETIQVLLDNSSVRVYLPVVLDISLPAGEEVKFFITRDPSEDNSGELHVDQVTATGLNPSASASVSITELKTVPRTN